MKNLSDSIKRLNRVGDPAYVIVRDPVSGLAVPVLREILNDPPARRAAQQMIDKRVNRKG